MNGWRSERGAVAVEFALVLPVLLALVLGIVEFGRAYNAQISVTHAAREAARTMAVKDNWPQAQQAARNAAPSLNSASMTLARTPASCASGATVTVTVRYTLPTATGFFGDDMQLTGTAAMRCGG